MTTELAIADSFAPVPMTASILADLRQQAEALDAAHQVAEWLCATGFAPDRYRDKPKEGAVAILYGARLGLDAIQSLQNVFDVYGVPSTYAKVMKAAVLAAGHEIWTVEKSATRCVVRGRRKGTDPNLPPEESVWDMKRVTDAGYDKRNPKYRTETENMLYARATAECCRATAPDVLLGIDSDIEEVRDRGPEPIRVKSERVSPADLIVESAQAGVVNAQQWQAPAPVDEQPVAAERAPSEPSAKPEPEQVSQPEKPSTRIQQKKVARLLNEQGVADDGDKLLAIGKFLEREIAGADDITWAEAVALLEYLERDPGTEDQAATVTEGGDQ
ncbi:hypothetical protein ACIBG0_40025 [Nocardia sp. NPDC050630]|uniref:hypothetical protein n=1 Tax=Nocardia sp. NPDC050630 TaxID=3364321 RepID=UPI0037A881CD